MTKLPRLAIAVIAGLVLSAAVSRACLAEDSCPGAKLAPASLPHSRAALAKQGEFLIVALGSSSTQGHASSDAGHSYPAVLQARLAAALPRVHVAVINRGIGGQTAADELARLEPDAVSVRPSLVIWQVGANGALRHTPAETFKRVITAGVTRLQAAGADVILMDNQRAPMILASAGHIRFDQALADVAIATGASLFSRGGLMDRWREGGTPYEAFIAPDGLHHNDRGYRCVAAALAAMIVEGLSDPEIGRAPQGREPRTGAQARRD